jgi:hypothetical protein
LTALDAAFEDRDNDVDVKDNVRDWLYGEELSTPDEGAEDMAEEALVAAVGV